MNLHKLAIALSGASKGRFGTYPRYVQEKIVKDAQKGLDIDPIQKFEPDNKELRKAIYYLLEDEASRNKYNRLSNAIKNPRYLEKIADNMLTKDVVKNKDYTLINPEDITTKRNPVSFANYKDKEGNELTQDQAMDLLLSNENKAETLMDYDEDVMNAKTFRDLGKIKGLDDVEQKGLTILQSEPYTAVSYLEDQPELMKALAFRINWNRDQDAASKAARGWKHLRDESKDASPTTIYSSDVNKQSFNPYTKEESLPIDALSKNIRDNIQKHAPLRDYTEEEVLQNKLHRGDKLRDFMKDYYKIDDSRAVDIDPQTGDILSKAEKAEQWAKYQDAPEPVEDILYRLGEDDTSVDELSDLYSNLDPKGRALDKYGDYIPQDKLEDAILQRLRNDILDQFNDPDLDEEDLSAIREMLSEFDIKHQF